MSAQAASTPATIQETLWSTANSPKGGRRSFPVTSDPAFARFAYDPPNIDYEHLFYRHAAISTSQPSTHPVSYSAGWLLPDQDSVCNPVFVAHSTMSAIWLLRESLINQNVPDTVWSHLVCAANQLANPDTLPPPSAQPVQPAQLAVAACTLDAERRKRPNASPEPSTPKRPCHALADSPETDASPAATHASPTHASPAATPTHASPRSSPVGNKSPSPQPAIPTITVTNHNRRAEQKREKKRQLAKVKRLAGLGLIAPTNSPPSELLAFNNVQPQDVEHFSWAFKQKWQQDNPANNQDLYHACKTPYTTTTLLLDRARLLGNPTSQSHAAQFLQSWRETGSPFHTQGQSPQPPSSALTQATSTLRPEGLAAKAACFAWDMVRQINNTISRVHIQYRWAAALLAKAYKDKIAEIHEEEHKSNDKSHNRYGKGRVDTEAREWLMHVLGIENNNQVKARFKKQLDKARRWYTLVQGLGWGILMLIPDVEIPHIWIEKEATVPLLRIWIDLVKRVNPTVYAASVAFEQWLGEDCISGATITSKQMLSIEMEASRAIYEVEEVCDSEEEEEEEESSDEDSSGVEAPQRTPLPALRQMTLLELFKPNE